MQLSNGCGWFLPNDFSRYLGTYLTTHTITVYTYLRCPVEEGPSSLVSPNCQQLANGDNERGALQNVRRRVRKSLGDSEGHQGLREHSGSLSLGEKEMCNFAGAGTGPGDAGLAGGL